MITIKRNLFSSSSPDQKFLEEQEKRKKYKNLRNITSGATIGLIGAGIGKHYGGKVGATIGGISGALGGMFMENRVSRNQEKDANKYINMYKSANSNEERARIRDNYAKEEQDRYKHLPSYTMRSAISG